MNHQIITPIHYYIDINKNQIYRWLAFLLSFL